MELGAFEATTRWVGVDPEQLAHPCLTFEVNGDAGTEVASHPTHEDAPARRTHRSPTELTAIPAHGIGRVPRHDGTDGWRWSLPQLGRVEDDAAGERVELTRGNA